MNADSEDLNKILSNLPSVDELLKSPQGVQWTCIHKKKLVLSAIRNVISDRRNAILKGRPVNIETEFISLDIERELNKLSSFSLVPVINATGIVIHTNLGRAAMSDNVMENILKVGNGYSNLEYDLVIGKRGQRHVHNKRLLREITGAEDGLIVNNNAAAVLLCLNTLARDKEVIVSRSELVEIGGSFRVPDVMAASNAVLRDVGTTNKTHPYDYTNAINDNTGLLLKVHQSNYKIIGFTKEVKIEELVSIGKEHNIPVMFDLGSGCLVDLRPFGIRTEPSVQEIIRSGADIITFSGDKLLGGPQGGIILGKKKYIEKIQKNPLARALRIDKLTIAAFEATLLDYMDLEQARQEIPVLRMLLQPVKDIRTRANRIALALRRVVDEKIYVIEDLSLAGGGALPDTEFPTYAVSIKPAHISVNELESRLRQGSPPVIARIKSESLLLDARTIGKEEVGLVVKAVAAALSGY